jgi:Protein of unknown function (DUF1592)/Protein of unknown function (DUF1588)/Protein of unknown function (DUF1587)/Protein of unknown function (DUF1585)/Protein of unknown function (DUF1595)/Planctomycete cytochrome C
MKLRLSIPLLFLATSLNAAPLLHDAATYEATVRPFLETHCYKCHGPEKEKGDFRLDTLPVDFSDHAVLGHWIEVMDNLNLGEMPPEDEPAPPGSELAVVTRWIAGELRAAEAASRSTGGRELLRRLTRAEYANTVRDLLAVEFLPKEGPLDLLPPDGTEGGFDKVSRALLLDPSLMSQYFEVAALVADKAIVTGPPPVPTRRNRMEYEEMSGGIAYLKDQRDTILRPDGVITMQSGMRSDEALRHPWNDKLIPVRGRYTLRLRVGSDPGERGEPLYIRITREGDGDLWSGRVTGTLTEPQIIEITRPFDEPGSGEIAVKFENPLPFAMVNYFHTALSRESDKNLADGRAVASGRTLARMGAEGMISQSRPEPSTYDTSRFPRLFFDWIELEGPLYEQWPPRSTERLFPRGLEDSSVPPGEALTSVFTELLPRAFRRPVTSEEIARIVAISESELASGRPFPEAVQGGLVAMLCSPNFLLHLEGDASETPVPLNPHALANRLSYFLWSSLPDETLREAAHSGKLTKPENIAAEVDRMLADPKAEALVTGFAASWMKAGEFDRFDVDRNLYRDYYSVTRAGLNEAVNAEPLAFFREVLTKDLSVLNFLDSDWTMVNEPLASWYGLTGVSGADFQRVALPPESPRGGLVGMAALHKWGSDGNRTKPVERGKYVLDVLFNDPPDPPPPNVGEVEPNVEGAMLTVRQRLDQHRSIESCRNCHARLDPYGLGLENFNVVGLWRDQQDGEREWWPREAVIDSSGVFPNGRSFATFVEYRAGLTEQSDRFLRGLAEKMFVYALGRTVESTDRGTIDELVAAVQAGDLTLRSLVKAIVQSEAFLKK